MDGRTHYMAGLDALQVGDEKRAWDALFLCLCKTPDNSIAQRLLRQIESPPAEFFGDQYTEYQVQPGDTLSKIAKQAYGDPFLFYALARYNGIDNPSQLRTEQTLRVPSPRDGGKVELPAVEPAPAPQRATAPASEDRTPPEVAADPPAGRYPGKVLVTLRASDAVDPAPAVHYSLGEEDPGAGGIIRYTVPIAVDVSTTLRFYAEDRSGNRSAAYTARYEVGSREKLRDVEALRDRGELAAALAALDSLLATDPNAAAARRLYQEVSVAHADALVRRDELRPAREVLQRAATVAGGSAQVSQRLAAVEQRIGIEQLFADATRAIDATDYEAAYTALNQVLKLDRDHPVAREKLVVVRSALIDRTSKEAMGAYRRQDLAESIRLWDRVLELDPADETAQLRRAEAVHLQQQFQQKFQ
ncbi:MAG: LysM peptidoglycan-binding domain-containing protein [Deferrisomatales bacterium]|nr:LysM peptidoglycan-binding domain-containing protein [Deferrisomatales bacterium]